MLVRLLACCVWVTDMGEPIILLLAFGIACKTESPTLIPHCIYIDKNIRRTRKK